MGTERIRNFGESWSDSENVSPWASPIVVVPKEQPQGNPLKEDYVLTIEP